VDRPDTSAALQPPLLASLEEKDESATTDTPPIEVRRSDNVSPEDQADAEAAKEAKAGEGNGQSEDA